MTVSIDVSLRRLAARGDFRVTPSMINERFAVAVTWAPAGQFGNPFCFITAVRPTLAEALNALLDKTAPAARGLDDVVAHRLAGIESTCRVMAGWVRR